MEWEIKTIGHRTIALHQHEDVWVESYIEKDQFLCCKCDEPYPNSAIFQFIDCDPRPNCKSYWEVSSYFRKKELKIRPLPCSNPEEWNDYGHIHEEVFWKPIIVEKNTICPSCLEIAPKEYSDLKVINDISKGFKTTIKINDKEQEIIVQLV